MRWACRWIWERGDKGYIGVFPAEDCCGVVESCLLGYTVGFCTYTCLHLCFGVDLVFLKSAACIRCQELTVGIPPKEVYKYKTRGDRQEQSHCMEPQLLATDALSCDRLKHIQYMWCVGPCSRASLVLPCEEDPRGSWRQLRLKNKVRAQLTHMHTGSAVCLKGEFSMWSTRRAWKWRRLPDSSLLGRKRSENTERWIDGRC